ncbi:MAG: T9SS type A sorting domain-containing protein [Bacteroidales bacterium]|nr:T9SS type A sorting domain-containing protein [Bacteroidales bacterium]
MKTSKKKLLIILFILFSSLLIKANPVISPPIISELYVSKYYGYNWEMELVNSGNYSLDDMYITSSTDTAFFKSGITFEPGETITINQSDLVSPLFIDIEGDEVTIYYIDWPISDFPFIFGNYPNSKISSPYNGQSLVNQKFHNYGDDDFWWIVKERHPTFGRNAFITSTRGLFKGFVYDALHKPISNVNLKYSYYSNSNFWIEPYISVVYTNENGYFESNLMFCRKFNLCVNYKNITYLDTLISIEPDSVNYFEFTLDTLFVGLNDFNSKNNISIKNYPNPFNQKTTISAEMPKNKKNSNVLIKIFNLQGEMIKIIPVNNSSNNDIKVTIDKNKLDLSSGTYIYTLEIGHKKIATNKMTVI